MACSVKLCKNYFRMPQKPSGLSFYQFPKENNLLQEWLNALNIQGEWSWSKGQKVCSQHFNGSDFIFAGEKKFLKPEAVPCLLLQTAADTSSGGHIQTDLMTEKQTLHPSTSSSIEASTSFLTVESSLSSTYASTKHEIKRKKLHILKWKMSTPQSSSSSGSEAMRICIRPIPVVAQQLNSTSTDSSTKRRREEIVRETHSYRCKEIFSNESELVKTENNGPINESQLLYDVTFEDCKIKNEEDIKEEDSRQETRYEELFPNKPFVKIENYEATNEYEQINEVVCEERKIKNEEVDIQEEDLKFENRYEEIFSNKPFIKIENYEATNEYEQINEVVFKDWKIKNEEVDIQEEDLKFENRYEEIFPNKPFVQMENYEATNESEQIDDMVFEDWKIKNEEVDIKEEDLKFGNSMRPYYIGQERQNDQYLNLRIQNHQHKKPVESNLNMHLLQHKNSEEVNIFKCDQCEYQAIRKFNLKMHRLRHKNPEEVTMFKCHQCDYKAIRKCHLETHLLRHKDPKEVSMFKCHHCDYKSIRKDNLNSHLLIHENLKEINLFKCDQCDYQTIRNFNLKMHLLRHKNPDEVTMFKCHQCDYKAIRKCHLETHLRRHKDPKESCMFKCHHCDYKSIRKDNLNSHLLRHKDPKEVKMFKCDQCDYQSIRKGLLKSHLLRHKDPNEVDTFKCDQCNYRTIVKAHLNMHLLRHKDPQDANIFRCDQCDHTTNRKDSLKKHLLRHGSPEAVNMFKCNQCDYQSTQKCYLTKHLLRHKDPKEALMFKCYHCDYQSIRKSHLKSHLRRHKNPEVVNIATDLIE